MVRAVTSAFVCQLPHARVLAASLRRHHPDSELVVVLLDGGRELLAGESGFRGLVPGDLGLDPPTLADDPITYSRLARRRALWRLAGENGAATLLAVEPALWLRRPLPSEALAPSVEPVLAAGVGASTALVVADAAAAARLDLLGTCPQPRAALVCPWEDCDDGDEAAAIDFTRFLPADAAPSSAVQQEYARELLAHGWAELHQLPFGSVLGDDGMYGWPLSRQRRAALAAGAERGDLDWFVSWLRAPAVPGSGVSRWLHAVWLERRDLQEWLPDPHRRDAARLVRWARDYGVPEGSVDAAVVPLGDLPAADFEDREPPPADPRPAGPVRANVIGLLDHGLGLGEAGRRVLAALDASGTPALPLDTALHIGSERVTQVTAGGPDEARFPISILCINGDGVDDFARGPGAGTLDGRYVISCWYWEVRDSLPESWRTAAARHLDEVWVASDFVRSCVEPHVDVPVSVLPIPLDFADDPPPFDRAAFGLPEDAFVFAFAWDSTSVPGRKNPLGLIRAFTREFSPEDGAVLLLKVSGADRVPHGDAVWIEASRHPHVRLVSRYLEPAEMSGLLAGCDCYVSLHRAEGVGLTIAEAMYHRTPVIATAFGGNVEFMDPAETWLVDCEPAEVGEAGEPIYPAEGRWAEPDLDHAAALMRRVFGDREAAAARSESAARSIRERFSLEATGARMAARLAEVWPEAARRAAVRAEAEATIPQPPPPGHDDLREWIAQGPPLGSGVLRRARRRALLRLTRAWAVHQQEVDRRILDQMAADARHAARRADALREELAIERARRLAAERLLRRERGLSASRPVPSA